MLQWGVLPKGGFIGSLKAGHWLMPQVGDYGLLLYPLVAATILDSYRLPLIIQNLIFGNIVALLIICFISKRFVVRFDQAAETELPRLSDHIFRRLL